MVELSTARPDGSLLKANPAILKGEATPVGFSPLGPKISTTLLPLPSATRTLPLVAGEDSSIPMPEGWVKLPKTLIRG